MDEKYLNDIFEDTDVETVFLVNEIREGDTTLMFHVLTRNEEHAVQSLEALRDSFNVLLKDPGEKSNQYHKKARTHVRAGILWPLDITSASASASPSR